MRKVSEIRARIAKLEECIEGAKLKIEEYRLNPELEELAEWKETFWKDAIVAFREQIYGMRFALGECD